MTFFKVMETLLDNKSDNFKFWTSFSLDIKPDEQERKQILLCF